MKTFPAHFTAHKRHYWSFQQSLAQSPHYLNDRVNCRVSDVIFAFGVCGPIAVKQWGGACSSLLRFVAPSQLCLFFGDDHCDGASGLAEHPIHINKYKD